MSSPIRNDLIWFQAYNDHQILNDVDQNFKYNLKNHVFNIINKVNRSTQEKIDTWEYYKTKGLFSLIFKAVARLALSKKSEFDLTVDDRYQLLTFINHCFNSIEVEFVNKEIRKYLALTIWVSLSPEKRESELAKLPDRIRLAWKKLELQDQKLSEESLKVRNFERTFVYEYIRQFLRILPGCLIDSSEDDDSEEQMVEGFESNEDISNKEKWPELYKDYAIYCQRFIEFIIDIESQIPLRRFFHPLLEYTHFIDRCKLSDLAKHKSIEGHLFDHLMELLMLYSRYEIDLITGEPLTELEIIRKHEEEIFDLQRVIWSKYEHLKKFAIKSVKTIDSPGTIYQIITSFEFPEKLYEFLKDLGHVDEQSIDEEDQQDIPLLASILINKYRRFESQLKKINSISLFPNESIIWDTNLVPDKHYNYETPLALPKLNLRFLTISDYLLRNFMLFKHESTYEIRQDLEDAITKCKCHWTSEGNFATGPKQRLALIIKHFSIIDVGKPKLGENCPSRVRAKIVINMDFVRPEWRMEWEKLRKFDTCFLISFRKPNEPDQIGWPDNVFPQENNVKFIRGCEIDCLLDSDGKVIDEYVEVMPKFKDNLRTFLVNFDCNQYQMDENQYKDLKQNVYDKFHLFVRRKPEKNNFKGVLDTIRCLMNEKFILPDWIKNLLIGFGDPNEAHYSQLRGKQITLDLCDTFLDYQHLRDSLTIMKPDYKISLNHLKSGDENNVPDNHSNQPSFKLEIDDESKEFNIIPYKKPSPHGPYKEVRESRLGNKIRFTPSQCESIISSLQPGLSLIVGDSCSGKTEIAVQILRALYHQNPKERTLIVTHSNQALNKIFDRLLELDVEEHHLLRMGHGEEDLQSEQDFSRQGRVKYVLSRRDELLKQVEKLSKSLHLGSGQKFTCQSAEYFDSFHVVPRWIKYCDSVLNGGDSQNLSEIGDKFPFVKFFEDAPQPIFKARSLEEDKEIANECYDYIREIFTKLRATRPFEIFDSLSDRNQYFLNIEAKLIAMTATHAALKRTKFVELNFQYDNILMEDSGQILEIETAITLLLQNPENGVNRLKRWIMIGDHNRIPPTIQNSALKKFSNMQQSLFARFIRLGVPTIKLERLNGL